MSSVTVASRVSQGNFTSTLYKWDAASPKATPDWTAFLDRTSVIGMDVSADGSIIGVAAYVNVSYYQPPTYQVHSPFSLIGSHVEVLFLDGQSGQEHVEYRYNGEAGEEGADLALNDDGTYAAILSALGTSVSSAD
jgi:hypothetical protein